MPGQMHTQLAADVTQILHERAYAAAAGGSDDDWAAFEQRFLSGDEAAYQAAVQQFQEEQA